MAKPIIFSGIQPSGRLMLGNYLGALKNWVKLQETHECLYCLVDLHAITVPQDPVMLRHRSYEGLATYLAAGLDPEKNILFLQSQVPQHAELGWILICSTYMGELERMTQYKDKSAKQKSIGAGLFAYPSLMAADILLYQTNLVPVGQDQKQHLELARDLAQRFNNAYAAANGPPIFTVPEVYIPPVGAKIMSLQAPTQKMSKSDPDPNATVFLTDTDKEIEKKIKRAVTDSGSEVVYQPDNIDRAGVNNLLSIQAAILNKSPYELVVNYSGKQYGHLKIETAEIVVNHLRPMKEQYERLLSDKGELNRILEKGAADAAERAEKTLVHVRDKLGFIAKASTESSTRMPTIPTEAQMAQAIGELNSNTVSRPKAGNRSDPSKKSG